MAQSSKGRSQKSPAAPRADRVSERVRAELMDLILRGELKDPDADGVTVLDVKMSADLRQARVYVRHLLGSEFPADGRKRLLSALERAKGFLRREVTQRAGLRYAPDLRFFWDDGIDDALRIEGLLDEIRREPHND